MPVEVCQNCRGDNPCVSPYIFRLCIYVLLILACYVAVFGKVYWLKAYNLHESGSPRTHLASFRHHGKLGTAPFCMIPNDPFFSSPSPYFLMSHVHLELTLAIIEQVQGLQSCPRIKSSDVPFKFKRVCKAKTVINRMKFCFVLVVYDQIQIRYFRPL